jgi:hypothetical protein
MSESYFPRPRREGEGSRRPWATGARSRNKRRRVPCARRIARSPTSTDPRCVEVVGVPLGPGRPVHTDPPTASAAPAPASRARSKAPPDRGANREGRERIGALSEKEFLAAGVALYAGEGAKGDGTVQFANTDPSMIRFFCAWLRRFLDVDASRLRVRVYLHTRVSTSRARRRSGRKLIDVSREQFRQAHRAVPDATNRHNKHEHACAYVYYSSSTTHRQIMGLVRALLSTDAIPG